ncbi:hypothetical protein DFH28DRAFT_924711 [Melampsora americana]|nr:hypothetical protein DFH28DRAFT_924711 [Melampsora americana]
MLMALSLQCTLQTVNKLVGKCGKKTEASSYTWFLEFGKQALEDIMPPPNDPLVSEKFMDQTQASGDQWSGMNSDQKAIFDHQLLLALAGLPDLAADHVESDSEADVAGDTNVLIPELLTNLYSHEFDFWLIAASSVPPLLPGTVRWCKLMSTLPIMTKWVFEKANFPTIFGTVAQGTPILHTITAQFLPLMPRPTSEKMQAMTRRVLLMLSPSAKLVDSKQSMPCGHDPGAVLAAQHTPVHMVQFEGLFLPETLLKEGSTKMGATGCHLWKQDVQNELFRFELIDQIEDNADYENNHSGTDKPNEDVSVDANVKKADGSVDQTSEEDSASKDE